MVPCQTVVISDLHLGAVNARHEDLLRFLDRLASVGVERLIVNGDLFDRPHLGRLADADVRVLEALRQFSLQCRLEWLVGNHDPSPGYFNAVLGLYASNEAIVDVGERRYLVCHGHAWDRALSWPQWLVCGADAVYRASQRVDRSHRFSRFLKRRCKRFVRAVQNLQDQAIAEVRRRGLDGVILGHTHVSADQHVRGVHYLNSGCWTERPTGYVAIGDGVARQEHFDPASRRFFVVRSSRSAIRLEAAASPGTRLNRRTHLTTASPVAVGEGI